MYLDVMLTGNLTVPQMQQLKSSIWRKKYIMAFTRKWNEQHGWAVCLPAHTELHHVPLSSLDVGQLYSLVWVDGVMPSWPPLQASGLSLFPTLTEMKSYSWVTKRLLIYALLTVWIPYADLMAILHLEPDWNCETKRRFVKNQTKPNTRNLLTRNTNTSAKQ